METRPSYYEILRISPKASDEDIKCAYRALAKKFHPDRNPQNQRRAEHHFSLINEAYAQLKTRESRIAYNRSLRMQAQNDNAHNGGFFTQIGEIFWPSKNTANKSSGETL